MNSQKKNIPSSISCRISILMTDRKKFRRFSVTKPRVLLTRVQNSQTSGFANSGTKQYQEKQFFHFRFFTIRTLYCSLSLSFSLFVFFSLYLSQYQSLSFSRSLTLDLSLSLSFSLSLCLSLYLSFSIPLDTRSEERRV